MHIKANLTPSMEFIEKNNIMSQFIFPGKNLDKAEDSAELLNRSEMFYSETHGSSSYSYSESWRKECYNL